MLGRESSDTSVICLFTPHEAVPSFCPRLALRVPQPFDAARKHRRVGRLKGKREHQQKTNAVARYVS